CSGYVSLVLNLRMRSWSMCASVLVGVEEIAGRSLPCADVRLEAPSRITPRCRFVISHVVALDRDQVCEILGVVPHAPDEARPAPRLPGQPQEIDAGLRRDTAVVFRTALLVERIDP